MGFTPANLEERCSGANSSEMLKELFILQQNEGNLVQQQFEGIVRQTNNTKLQAIAGRNNGRRSQPPLTFYHHFLPFGPPTEIIHEAWKHKGEFYVFERGKTKIYLIS